MFTLERTTPANPGYQLLIPLLDSELRIRDGEDHAFYAQYNHSDSIRHVVIARIGAEPVGCGAFKPWQGNTVEIKRMFVLPAYRGQGIALAVLSELERWAAAEGYTDSVLETGLNQPEAIALYRKAGYLRMENYGQYAGMENSVCMQKTVLI